MNKLFKNPSHEAKIGYNGFPMSNLLKFTSTVGELLPVYYDILQPGDKVTCGYELKTRTMELASAAMMSITENVDWFFVPMTQIYQFFGDWYFGIQDFKTSFVNTGSNNVNTVLPFIPYNEFSTFLHDTQAYPDNLVDGGYLTNHDLQGTSLRLLDLLGIPATEMIAEGDTPQSGEVVKPASLISVCPLFFCAYQKIWYDNYRISDRLANDPSAYNLDKYLEVGTMTMANDQTTLAKMFSLRYRPWKRNFYTSLYTSPLFGGGSIGAFSELDADTYLLNSFQQWLVNLPDPVLKPDSVEPTSVQRSINASSTTQIRANTEIITSPTGIRSQFALQKLLEITRRAGKHFDEQTLAHFGIKPPTGISGESMFLGHSESVINIGDVIATAGTESTPLGKIGGKGYGFGKGNKIKFTAPCHGILMALYSAEPEQDFTAVGFDKLNCLMNRADWFSPEFDNLGMQPLFLYQADYPTALYSGDSSVTPNTILGWQYRFSELKTKYNRVVGGLTRELSFWTPQTVFNSNHLSSFYVNPKYLDSVMLVPYTFNGARNSETVAYDPYRTDPLFHEIYLDVQKASKMSTFGLESL